MLLDLLDMINLVDRAAGAASATRQGQMGRQVRIRHRLSKDAPTAAAAGTQSMNEYSDVLARYKIPVFWKRATSEQCIFNVRSGQWQWSIDLLYLAGADVVQRPSRWAVNYKARNPGKMPPPWAWREKTPARKGRRR